MKTESAVLVQTGKPLEITELEIPALKPGQTLVEILYTNICHTQILECRGHRGQDKFLPHCLGHEGSGIVLEIGPGVKRVKPGDSVILSWMKSSGADVPATQYQWNGKTVNSGAITTFNRVSIVSENRLTVVPTGFSMKDAALLGCAIPTGLGTIMNTAQPKPGQSIAIFGAGGIGLCAIMASDISGCVPVIAVDVRQDKLDLAKQFGASHTINAKNEDPVETIFKLCQGGSDFAVDASGTVQAMSQAFRCVRNQGGTAVIIGNAKFGEPLSLDPWQFNLGKRLLGTWGGDNQPDRDFPRYIKLVQSGKLSLKAFLSNPYRLSDINQAIDDLENGKVLRPMIDMKA